jgi:FkbM family methyltransferase
MRLFRQRQQGDWKEVMARVRNALEEWARSDHFQQAESNGKSSDAAPSACLPLRTKPSHFRGRSAPAETAMGIVQYFPDRSPIGESIAWYGEYLRAQTDMLATLMEPGSVVMEAGAGIGAHALSLAPVIGNAGHFLLYESRALFQQVLRQNLAANGISNVTVMKRALRGQSTSKANRMDDSCAEARSADPKSAGTVTETIDELRLDRLDWLKIGEECDAADVLEGASETLWRVRPKLFVAVQDDDDVSRVELRVRDRGYQCWKVTTSYFNRANFNRRDDDIFSGRMALAVLAIPEEIEFAVALDGCEKL